MTLFKVIQCDNPSCEVEIIGWICIPYKTWERYNKEIRFA